MPRPRHSTKATSPRREGPVVPFEGNEALVEQYGGDYAVIRTIPDVHPRTGRPMDKTRKSLIDPTSLGMLMRGDVVFKPNMAAEFQIAMWPDDGTAESKRLYRLMTLKKGYEVAKADEWYIRPELEESKALEKTPDNRIIAVTSSKSCDVMMVRRKELLLRDEAEERKVLLAGIHDNRDSKLAEAFGADDRVGVLPTSMTVERVPESYRPDTD